MHKQLSCWEFLLQQLRNEQPVMLMYVIESRGSSPGRQGFMMVVNAAGEMHGSLGGGIMEHKFVELAKTNLSHGIQDKTILYNQKHDKLAARNQSGMICSGEQTIFMYSPRRGDVQVIELLVASLRANRNGCLQLSANGISFSDTIPGKDFHLAITSQTDFIYQEKSGYKNELYIIGGGHVALALSKLVADMDFYVRLFDHRENLHTISQNTYVHEKHLVNDYSTLGSLVPGGPQHFGVIMTVGYRTDAVALRTLLGKEWKYLGVLGSSYKISKLMTDLKLEGIGEEALKRLHAPIGLPLKSQTPEEIAVSILAEIIMVKNSDF